MAQIIEIALSIYAPCIGPTFEKLFTCVKFGAVFKKLAQGTKQSLKLTHENLCVLHDNS